jgi:hypothetical protein
MTTADPDPWPAIDELAHTINDLATEVAAHSKQLQRLAPAPTGSITPIRVDNDKLRDWVQALVEEFGLHGLIGRPDRWENIPPLRAELVGLMIADVRGLKLEQGSFELVYWHDALARVLDRASWHVDRWRRNQQEQELLRAHR